jgi:hypothetical protein
VVLPERVRNPRILLLFLLFHDLFHEPVVLLLEFGSFGTRLDSFSAFWFGSAHFISGLNLPLLNGSDAVVVFR